MSDPSINITGQRQLLIDPRVVEKYWNVLPAMAEAKKLGKVIALEEKYHGNWAILYASAVWDEAIKKVRIYYNLISKDLKDERIALAESSDGIHFTKPRLNLVEFEGDGDNNFIRIDVDIPHNDRLLEPRKVDHAIAMTGKLDDPAWGQSPATINFLRTGSMALSAFGTTVRVLYDNEAAYFGFECPGKKDWSKTTPPSDVYAAEVVEVLIDPKLTRNEHYYFAVNCFGQTAQERHIKSPHPSGDNWQTQWQAAVNRRADGWSAVFRIPFKTIELEPKQIGCAWGLNLGHNCPAWSANEYSRSTNWAGAPAHHRPDRFGALVFHRDEFQAKHRAHWEALSKKMTGDLRPLDVVFPRDAPCVFIDPNGPASERYKMTWASAYSYMWAGASADGMTFKAQKIVIDGGNLDSPNRVVWDHLKKKYVAYTRWWWRGQGAIPEKRRGVARTESDEWAVEFPPRQAVMDPKKYLGNEAGVRDFHSTGFFIYENLYLALTTVYWRDLESNPFIPSLFVSVDGIDWKWIGQNRTIIPRTHGAWDQGRIDGTMPPIAFGDQLYLYYFAIPFPHGHPMRNRSPESGIGVASIRRDGFMSYCSVDAPGFVQTQPLVFNAGETLYVNATPTFDNGEVRVEVVGDDRFSAEKCEPITTDGINIPVRWKGASFGQLKGKTIQLKFRLTAAKMYACEVK